MNYDWQGITVSQWNMLDSRSRERIARLVPELYERCANSSWLVQVTSQRLMCPRASRELLAGVFEDETVRINDLVYNRQETGRLAHRFYVMLEDCSVWWFTMEDLSGLSFPARNRVYNAAGLPIREKENEIGGADPDAGINGLAPTTPCLPDAAQEGQIYFDNSCKDYYVFTHGQGWIKVCSERELIQYGAIDSANPLETIMRIAKRRVDGFDPGSDAPIEIDLVVLDEIVQEYEKIHGELETYARKGQSW